MAIIIIWFWDNCFFSKDFKISVWHSYRHIPNTHLFLSKHVISVYKPVGQLTLCSHTCLPLFNNAAYVKVKCSSPLYVALPVSTQRALHPLHLKIPKRVFQPDAIQKPFTILLSRTTQVRVLFYCRQHISMQLLGWFLGYSCLSKHHFLAKSSQYMRKNVIISNIFRVYCLYSVCCFFTVFIFLFFHRWCLSRAPVSFSSLW